MVVSHLLCHFDLSEPDEFPALFEPHVFLALCEPDMFLALCEPQASCVL